MGFVPSGRHTAALRYKSHKLETHGTTITLLSTPFNAHPNPQSPQTNPTIHNTQVHTTIPKQLIGNYGVCGWKDRCRDGNLRTYCHVSPILFGWFFVEASPTCFCIFVKCFFCNCYYISEVLFSIEHTKNVIEHRKLKAGNCVYKWQS